MSIYDEYVKRRVQGNEHQIAQGILAVMSACGRTSVEVSSKDWHYADTHDLVLTDGVLHKQLKAVPK